MKRLFITYFALMVLLALAVAAARVDFGPYHMTVSLGIASIKTALVAWVFMELRTSPAIMRLAAAAGLLWIFFFYFLSALDIGWRLAMPGSSWR